MSSPKAARSSGTSNNVKTEDLIVLQTRIKTMKTTIESTKKSQENKSKNPASINFDSLIDRRANQTEVSLKFYIIIFIYFITFFFKARLKTVFDNDVEDKCGEVLIRSKRSFKDNLNPYLHKELPKELDIISKKLDTAKTVRHNLTNCYTSNEKLIFFFRTSRN